MTPFIERNLFLLCKSIAKTEMCHFLAPARKPEMMHKNFMHRYLRIFVVRCSCMKFYAEMEKLIMHERLMKKNYGKAFKTIVVLAVLLALASAVVVPLSLSQQLSDLSSLKQTAQQTVQQGETHGEHHTDHEELWKSRITPPTAGTLAALGGIAVLWLALGIYYWLLVIAWLYKSAVNEGMNKSLWPILGLFTNLLAVFAFLIVRDDPRRAKCTGK